ncbi:MAG TPA: LLM class flavin-dependent oxidoreductase [Terriglobales bacterium]|nr:LLM class flavin-dependent oxidoreductase [Terriglobales bacterium]
MSVSFNLGVLQLSMEPVRETVAMAKACEQAGFDAFWVAEAYPWWRKHSFEARSSTAILAVIAAATRRLQLGWGIISPYSRHPVQIAMEARVMQELAADRFLLGLGASKIFMKEIGEESGEKVGPATVMRESIEIVRGVLQGDRFQYQGKVFAANVPPLKPDARTPRGTPPIYLAATGPVLQKMSGSIADGLLTASITTPAFVRHSRKNMEAGARRAERDPSTLILGSVIVGSISRDSSKGKAGAREQAAMYLANKVENIGRTADVLLECAGLSLEELRPVADAMERGGRTAAAKAVSDALLTKVCPIAGTPEECIERIREYREAGCTHIMLEIWGDDRIGQAKLFGEAVVPYVRS